MTKSASRQKANNANAATNAPVMPASAKETAEATQAAKATTTVPAAPTHDVQSAGKNTNKNGKNSDANATADKNVNANKNKTPNTNANANNAKTTNKNANTNPNTTKTTKTLALSDLTASSVQQARQIRKTDFERFQKFHNFFAANDAATAGVINGKAGVKREQVDEWVRGTLNAKALACIQEIQETQEALMALLMVSASLTKYGEQELARRDNLGEMDYVVGARFGTSSLRSKQHVPQMVGLSFLLRLVLGLAPEKRAACQILREILTHESNAHLVLTPMTKGLQPAFGSAAADSDDWSKTHQNLLRQMARQAQSDKFQEAMQQLGGEHLYDTIRTQLKQAGGVAVWEAAKDKHALQAKNIRPRPNAMVKSATPQKEAQRPKQQPAKKNSAACGVQTQNVKKSLPVEAEKWSQVPPPAPVTVKSATNVQVKKEAALKSKTQTKNAAPEKNGSQVKNATPAKNATPVKNAKNATPVKNESASVAQSRPGAIVSSAPTTGGRPDNGSRAILTSNSRGGAV